MSENILQYTIADQSKQQTPPFRLTLGESGLYWCGFKQANVMSDEHDKKTTGPSDPSVWVDEHGDYLYNYAYSRLRNETAAEDAVQETFLAGLKGRQSFSGASSERTWLVGILKHKVIDYWRKAMRETPSDQLDSLPCESEKVMQESGKWTGAWIPERSPLDWGDNPGSNLDKKEFWEVLDRCLKGLPDRITSCSSR